MDRSQINRVTMFKTVDGYLEQRNGVWSPMAPFAAAMLQFRDKLAAIDAAAQKQESPLAGATGDKEAARDALEDVLFLTCEALGVLANTTSDHELGALVALSPSAIVNLSNEELSNRATNVLAKTNARKAELAAFQVTQENIDELSEALEAFQAAKEKPRTAVVERTVQTGSLSSLIREAGNILRDRVDKMVNLFRRTDPEFVAGYRSARVIVDRRGSRPAPVEANPTSPTPPST